MKFYHFWVFAKITALFCFDVLREYCIRLEIYIAQFQINIRTVMEFSVAHPSPVD
jgi:hypothetical protein